MSAELCQKLRAVEYGIPLGTGTFCRPNPLTQKAAETIEKQAATIDVLQKRIGELEAEDEAHRTQIVSLQNQMFKERGVFAAERKRREECEKALRPFAEALELAYKHDVLDPQDIGDDRIYVAHSILKAARSYFTPLRIRGRE